MDNNDSLIIFNELIKTLDYRYSRYFEGIGSIKDYFFLTGQNDSLSIVIDKTLPKHIIKDINDVFNIAFS